MDGQGILIAGGYGVVGRRLAADLAPHYPGRVILAGRSQERAQAAAAAIGYGVRGRSLDIADPASIANALIDVGAVVSCIDQPDRKLLWAALRRGLRYTDITPHLNGLGRGEAYDQLVAAARASGARLVLGTGIVPGISNVAVRALADRLGGVDEIETALLLNAGDISGAASFDYFLQELSMRYDAWIDGADRPTAAFTSPRTVCFPDPVGERQAFLFPFSDQVLYPRTMGVRTVVTRLAIDPGWVASFLHMLTRTGGARLLRSDRLRRSIARTRRDRPSSDGKTFALRVEVRRGAASAAATLLGRTQADAAAAGAAGVLRALVEDDSIRPGAWMPEQVIAPPPFLERLERRGFRVQIATTADLHAPLFLDSRRHEESRVPR